MKTLKKVKITSEYVEIMPSVEEMEERVIYISKRFETSIHRCLCGCGEPTVLPFNNIIDGKDLGWTLIERNGKISITPSVGNYQIPCKSHYIITNSVANFV